MTYNESQYVLLNSSTTFTYYQKFSTSAITQVLSVPALQNANRLVLGAP